MKRFSILVLLLCLIILNNSSVSAGGIKLAVFDLAPSGDIKTDLTSLTEVLIAEIDKLDKYSIISQSEIKAMVGFEQEKQLLGCQDDTSCLAEIGGALGVDRLITGSVGKLGNTIIVSIKLINTKNVTTEGRVYESFKGNESLLVDTLKRLVPRLFGIAIKEKGLGTLIIESELKGAKIYLDGNPIGNIPFKPMKLKEGEYNVQVTKKGYKNWSGKIKIKGKQATEVDAVLTKKSGSKTAATKKKEIEKKISKAVTTKAPAKIKSKQDSGKTPWYKSWWALTVLGGVVAGSAAVALAGSGGADDAKTPESSKGKEIIFEIPLPNE